MGKDIAIQTKNITKEFVIPHKKSTSLKQLFVHLGRKGKVDRRKVLNDISFDINKGDFFGIVGRNGSGKSTLLKLLAGVYTPTKGAIYVNGSLTPFIELGVGFNPELTGRENVFLNGALLGFTHKQMKAMYQDIVDFAELEEYMDQKLKNYSSGMQVRLAFSIAIRAQSDVLLIDEVLAVGDSAFQQKCYDYFTKLKKSNRSIVFVSHDMGAVKQFCNKAILIEKGKIVKYGDPNDVALSYEKINYEKEQKVLGDKSPIKIQILDHNNRPKSVFEYGEKIRIKLEWPREMNPKNLGIGMFKDDTFVFGTNTYENKMTDLRNNLLEITLNLMPGRYKLIGGLFGDNDKQVIEFNSYGPEFKVIGNLGPINRQKWGGVTKLDYDWIK